MLHSVSASCQRLGAWCLQQTRHRSGDGQAEGHRKGRVHPRLHGALHYSRIICPRAEVLPVVNFVRLVWKQELEARDDAQPPMQADATVVRMHHLDSAAASHASSLGGSTTPWNTRVMVGRCLAYSSWSADVCFSARAHPGSVDKHVPAGWWGRTFSRWSVSVCFSW